MATEQKNEENRGSRGFINLCINFASNTTAHGFGQLVGNKSKSSRILWAVVILVCQFALYYQIYPLCVQFKQRPTKTKVDLKYEASQNFPVVTFCTSNAIKRSSVEQFEKDVRYFNVKVENHERLKRSFKTRSSNNNDKNLKGRELTKGDERNDKTKTKNNGGKNKQNPPKTTQDEARSKKNKNKENQQANVNKDTKGHGNTDVKKNKSVRKEDDDNVRGPKNRKSGGGNNNSKLKRNENEMKGLKNKIKKNIGNEQFNNSKSNGNEDKIKGHNDNKNNKSRSKGNENKSKGPKRGKEKGSCKNNFEWKGIKEVKIKGPKDKKGINNMNPKLRGYAAERKKKKSPSIPGLILSHLHNDESKYVIKNETKIALKTQFEMLRDYAVLAQRTHEGVFKYGHSLEETVTSCTWKSFYDCTGPAWWTPVWHWRYGNCFAFNSTDGDQRLQVNSVGPDNGLTVTLKLDELEFDKRLTSSNGIIVHIGDQGGRIEPYLNGYNLPPSFVHYFSLSKMQVKRADPFKNQSCLQHSNFDLGERFFSQRHVSKYSLQMCREVCLARAQIIKCKCTSHWLPSLNSNRTCDWTDTTCVNEHIVLAIKDKLPCLKKCRLPCEETSYEKEVSSRAYSKDSDQNTLQVVISFKTLETKITENVEYYFIENLLADIGGQLGLFSGISVLTVVEVAFLIGNLFFLVCQYKKKDKRTECDQVLMNSLS